MAKTPTKKKAQPITTENFIPLVHQAVGTMPLRSVNGSSIPKDSTFSEAWLDLGLNVRTIIDRQDAADKKQKETDKLLASEKAKRVLFDSLLAYIKGMAWWQKIFIALFVIEQVWIHGSAIDWTAIGMGIKHFFGF